MKKIFLYFSLFFISFIQAQQCTLLDAGADQTVNCTNNCTTLNATFLDGFTDQSTFNGYVIQNATPCPLPPVTNGTPTTISTDDEWSSLITMPFNFVYFGLSYNKIIIGDNGVVSFDTNRTSPQTQQAGGYCDWSFTASDQLPNTNMFRNTIFGAYHDLYIPAGGQIDYYVSGTAPQRIFVIHWNNIAQYSCNNLITDQRILLYETTNVIDVQITRKDICHGWQNGVAVVGIQDETGTIAYVPPGRNSGTWGVSNEELWRFVPDNTVVYPHTVTWYNDATNALVGTGDSINICETQTTTYRAELEFDAIDGTHYTSTDTVTVIFDDTHDDVDLGPDQDFCANTTVTLDATLTNATGYQWQLNGVDIPGATNPTYDATSSGTYSVTVDIGVCSSTDDITITVIPAPVVQLDPDFHFCEGETVTLNSSLGNPNGGETYQWYKDGLEVLGATADTLSITESGTYSLEVSNTTGCVGTDEIVATMDEYPNLNLGEDMRLCYDQTATIQSNITDADSYTWEVNGVTDPNTTDTLDISGSGIYDVTLTITRGTCSATDDIHIEILDPVSITSNPIFYGELDITATGGLPPYQYSVDGLNYQNSNHFKDLPDDDYPIFIKDANDCIYEFPPVHVTNLTFPKFFTPNGDGFNDTWRVEHAENTPKAFISIYDRFGKLLKTMNTQTSESWDGTFNGTPLYSGDYWYILTVKEGQIYKGHFSLKR